MIDPVGTSSAPRRTNAEALRALRVDAVARGLCLECRARPARPGVKTCQVCADRSAKRRADRRAAGLCECGRRPSPGRKICESCLGYRRAYDMLRAAVSSSQGMCVVCHDVPAAEGFASCQKHLDRSRESVRKTYHARLAAGRCVQCNRPNPKKTWRCEECAPRRNTMSKPRPVDHEARETMQTRTGPNIGRRGPHPRRLASMDTVMSWLEADPDLTYEAAARRSGWSLPSVKRHWKRVQPGRKFHPIGRGPGHQALRLAVAGNANLSEAARALGISRHAVEQAGKRHVARLRQMTERLAQRGGHP